MRLLWSRYRIPNSSYLGVIEGQKLQSNSRLEATISVANGRAEPSKNDYLSLQ